MYLAVWRDGYSAGLMHDDTTIHEGLLLSIKRKYATIFKKKYALQAGPATIILLIVFFYWKQWIPISCVPLSKDGCKCM